jgi:hypothetical protein
MIYSTRLIGYIIRSCMQKTILALFLAISLFPISHSFSQISDTDPTLGISLTSFTPFNYKDEAGYTIVLGEIENKKNFPIMGVKIFAGFYDDINPQPLESNIGTTILDIIPPFGKSPYLIKSHNPNSAITSVSVNLLGFNSSPPKQKLLSLEPGTLDISNELTLSGSIINNAQIDSAKTKVHLISYDGFIPPRVLGVNTLEIENIKPGASANFEFVTKTDFRAVSFKLVAESGNYQSNFIEITRPSIDALKKLVTINDISINDPQGNRLPDVPVGSITNIQSKIWIQYSSQADTVVQPYVYYVQIKATETGMVDFIGIAEGTFYSGGTQIPVVEWTSQNKGLYFAETFVWDPDGIPLASKGPLSLILVN